MINGILVIDKEQGMTSADVVYQLRKALHIRKIGHAGTLDPEVTGVLPIAIGQATKLIELMHSRNKKYVGHGLFGYATDSYDVTGQVLARTKMTNAISSQQIKQAMQAFVGDITQVPPIYSAVRVNGRHLYEYARAGQEVERPQRQVKVMAYDLLAEPQFDQKKGQELFEFALECSKGTYVRSLVNNLGEKLALPAVMCDLRRTASSGFTIEQAVKLDKVLANPAQITAYLQPLEIFFGDYPQIDLTALQWQEVQNGAFIRLETNAKKVALRYNKKVKAIYQLVGKIYRPDLMLLQNN